MNNSSINVKIFSDVEDIASVTSAVQQVKLRGYNLNISLPRSLIIHNNEVIIIQIITIDSRLLKRIIENKKKIKNRLIFVVPNSNALLISTVAKLGFTDIFILPYELYKLIDHIQEIINNNLHLTDSKPKGDFGKDIYDIKSMLGQSPNFKKILDLGKKVAENNVNCLILGETGSGKGMLAKAIHKQSQNSNAPFMEIVCTAIPENLLESELFGYEPGAFTHAESTKLGLFEIAENGTLFLDEIGDLSINLQTKLLRPIEKRVIRRLGGVDDIPIESRIISATNKNLVELVESNLFRRDLYHRLNVVSIEIPPLRDREGDIFLLAKEFIREFNRQFEKNIKGYDNAVKEFFISYPWPGNVREFRNAIERAVLLSESSTLKLENFSQIFNRLSADPNDDYINTRILPHIIRLDLNYTQTTVQELVSKYAKEVLEKTNGNKSKAAKLMEISRPRLERLLNTD